MKNTFTGAVLAFPNRGIHAIINDVMSLRKQLFLRPEFRAQSGWNDALNQELLDELEKLAVTVKRVTYSPTNVDPVAGRAGRLDDAKDTSRTLADAYTATSINADDLVMPGNLVEHQVAYDWTGAHLDYPQPTMDRIENDWARNFVINLDFFCVVATNLDSRKQPTTINAYESAQLLAVLNECYAILREKGGEENRSRTWTGVMASDKPSTFNADGAFDATPTDPMTPQA